MALQSVQLRLLLSAALPLLAAGAPSTRAANMNGAYTLTNTPKQVPGKFPTNYADYPNAKTEFFDLYSPVISSTYGEIVWKTVNDHPTHSGNSRQPCS